MQSYKIPKSNRLGPRSVVGAMKRKGKRRDKARKKMASGASRAREEAAEPGYMPFRSPIHYSKLLYNNLIG